MLFNQFLTSFFLTIFIHELHPDLKSAVLELYFSPRVLYNRWQKIMLV